MFIVGAGVACPDEVLSNDTLASLGLTLNKEERRFLDRSGVTVRRTSLPLGYISQTKNADVLAARASATVSPSVLAARAVQQAIERAGIGLEQVGLLIADTATPDQTCPSEAQRIGGLLGVKVAAYDIVNGSGSIPHYVDLLSCWKPDRVPDYVVCVSTNTPTQHVYYDGPTALPAYLFGDAAAAVVVSPRHPGRFRVVASELLGQSQVTRSIVVEKHISIDLAALPSQAELQGQLAQSIRQLSAHQAAELSSAVLVGPQMFAGDAKAVAASLGIKETNVITAAAEGGFALGASLGGAISSLWDTVVAGQMVIVVHAGEGLLSGVLLLASK